MRRTSSNPITVPASGMVKGGRLHGWHFHFLGFVLDGRALEILGRWTPPHWPFFREFAANHNHFGTLRPVVGDRAKRIPAEPLIASAYRAEGIEPPEWLIDSDMTLRARVKRTHGINTRRSAP